MISVRFNGLTKTVRFRGIQKAAGFALRRRWTVRVQLRCLDDKGRPARGLAEFRLPRAEPLKNIRSLVDGLLRDLGTDECREFEHVSATWVAVSER